MKLIAALIIAAQVAVIGQPPQPQQYTLYLPYVPVAADPTWHTVMTLQGKPFTDAVMLDGALIVSRQDGNIYKGGQLWAVVPVNATGEGGLNALATDGRRLWAGYVSTQSRITVAEIVNGQPVVLADFGVAAEEHNAAGLLYTNGKLLFGIGDNESVYTAQSATLAGGKLWWIDPLTGDTAMAAKGLRNPWHITQIGASIYVADVGESKYEEVNIFTQGGNYGWPCWEGGLPPDGEARVYAPTLCKTLVPYTDTVTGKWFATGSVMPALAYGRDIGRGVMGMSQMANSLVFADFAGVVRKINIDEQKRMSVGVVVHVFDAYVSKMTTAGAVVVLTMKDGSASVEVWR